MHGVDTVPDNWKTLTTLGTMRRKFLVHRERYGTYSKRRGNLTVYQDKTPAKGDRAVVLACESYEVSDVEFITVSTPPGARIQ